MTQSVNVPGVILSNLVFELNNAECDKEGLILGRVSSIVTDSITDSNISDIQHETLYNITTFVPARQVHSLFDWCGRLIDDEFCKSCHPHSQDEVIGWYKLRRQSSTGVSLRELSVHRNVQNWLEDRKKSSATDSRSSRSRSGGVDVRALFLLCVAGGNHSRSLHSADHIFMTRTHTDTTWCYLPLKVPNLSSLVQAEYRLVPLHGTTQLGAYADIVRQSESHFLDNSGELFSVTHLKELNEKLHTKLKGVCADLTVAEEAAEKKRRKIQELLFEIELAKDSVTQNSKQLRDLRRSKTSAAEAASSSSKLVEQQLQQVKAEQNLIDFDSDDDGSGKPSSKVTSSHTSGKKIAEPKDSAHKQIEFVTAGVEKTSLDDNSKISNLTSLNVESKSQSNVKREAKHANIAGAKSDGTAKRTSRSRSGSGPGLAAAVDSGKVIQLNHSQIDAAVNGMTSVGVVTTTGAGAGSVPLLPACDSGKQHTTRNQTDKHHVPTQQQRQHHQPSRPQPTGSDLTVVGTPAVTTVKVAEEKVEPKERRTKHKNTVDRVIELSGDEV